MADITFYGSVDGSWGNPDNWQLEDAPRVPHDDDFVYIRGWLDSDPAPLLVLFGYDDEGYGWTGEGTKNLTITPNRILNVCGDWWGTVGTNVATTISGGGSNYSNLGDNVWFAEGATNNGTVGDHATFEDSTQNNGTVGNYASFYSGEGDSQNNGSVGDHASFYGSTSNNGSVGDDASFYDDSQNNGTNGTGCAYVVVGTGGLAWSGDATDSVTAPAPPPAVGGLVWGGRAQSILINPGAFCSACNHISDVMTGGLVWGGSTEPIEDTGTGGLALGGSAVDSLWQFGGGLRLGGSARSRVRGDTYDGLAAVYPLDEVSHPYRDRANHLDSIDGVDPIAVWQGVGCSPCQSFEGAEWIGLPADKIVSGFPYTVSFWVQLSEVGSQRTLFCRGGTLQISYSILGNIMATIWTSEADYTIASDALQLDQWYLVAVVVKPGQGFELLINGSLVDSAAVSEAFAETIGGNEIGLWGLGSNPVAMLQEVRVYASALTEEHLSMTYQNTCQPGFFSVC